MSVNAENSINSIQQDTKQQNENFDNFSYFGRLLSGSLLFFQLLNRLINCFGFSDIWCTEKT